MWREPPKAEASKTALEKDPSAAARSSIRRGRAYRARRSGMLASFHSQIIDELRRGGSGNSTNTDRFPVRSPVLANGVSEDGMTLEDSRREALGRPPPPPRRAAPLDRTTRDQVLTNLITPDSANSWPSFASTPAYWGDPTIIRLPTGRSLAPNEVHLPPLRRTDSHGSNLALFVQANMPPEIRERREHRADTHSGVSRGLGADGTVDGLGDRQRSPSPDGERDTDAWETLLSTITPDTNLPSNDSSFASTSASAPDTRSNGPPPYGGRHALLDPYPDHLNPCDLSSSDDEDNPANYHGFVAPGGAFGRRRRDRSSTLSAHPPLPATSSPLGDNFRQSAEIQQMQVILDRLARREDIPDDWWAAVGLTRTLNRGLNASMDSIDTENTFRPRREQ